MNGANAVRIRRVFVRKTGTAQFIQPSSHKQFSTCIGDRGWGGGGNGGGRAQIVGIDLKKEAEKLFKFHKDFAEFWQQFAIPSHQQTKLCYYLHISSSWKWTAAIPKII